MARLREYERKRNPILNAPPGIARFHFRADGRRYPYRNAVEADQRSVTDSFEDVSQEA